MLRQPCDAKGNAVAAKNSGRIPDTVKHSWDECIVVERLEDDQGISVCKKSVSCRRQEYRPFA